MKIKEKKNNEDNIILFIKLFIFKSLNIKNMAKSMCDSDTCFPLIDCLLTQK